MTRLGLALRRQRTRRWLHAHRATHPARPRAPRPYRPDVPGWDWSLAGMVVNGHPIEEKR